MKAQHYLTLTLGTILTVAPQLITSIPPGYRDVATALLGLATAVYHLLQTSPVAADGGSK